MKIFVTGVNGQLGFDIVRNAMKRDYYVIGSDISPNYNGITPLDMSEYVQLDITHREKVLSILKFIKPDVIIHCAAWTNVDAAEEECNIDRVNLINIAGTKYIVEAAKLIDAKLVYISTDYIFDGYGDRPWKPEDTSFNPINIYGKSKLMGELEIINLIKKYFIVRISWVFGLNGKNFVKTMINIGKKNKVVRVINDQIGSPTYTYDVSLLLLDMIETEKYGYYHATNSGDYISWYDFTKEIYRQYGLTDVEVVPVSTKEYGESKASRPHNSRLSTAKLKMNGFNELPDWKDAIRRYLEEAKL